MRIRQSVGRAVAFVFAALVSLPAQNLPDFSGVWQLNKEKSRVEVRMAWAKVELTDAIFSVNLRVLPERGGEETSDWHFTMGSSESSNLMHGAPVKSHVERDGGTVVVRSVTMFGSDRLNTIARCAASPDGQTLTYMENHQYANGPERDSVFVFDRRPATTWPAAQSRRCLKTSAFCGPLPRNRCPRSWLPSPARSASVYALACGWRFRRRHEPCEGDGPKDVGHGKRD